MLLDRNGQGFTSEKKHGVNTYWQCSESRKQSRLNQEKCPARATTEGIYVKSWRCEHNHPFEDFEDENEFEDSKGLVEGSEDTTLGQIETKGIIIIITYVCLFTFLVCQASKLFLSLFKLIPCPIH